MNDILNDASTFVPLTNLDPFKNNLLLEDKLNRFLKQLQENSYLSDNEYTSLYASGSNPGIMYGLPKIHKDNVPLRPVLSSFKTFNYKLAKFLVPHLQSYEKNNYSLSNSYEFFNDVKDLNINNESFLVSLDVVSLYTNVPVSEVIDVTTNLVYDNDGTFRSMDRQLFRQFLNLAVGDSYFVFNELYYKQKDGLAMGCPLSATLANIFMCHHESIWLDDCPIDFKPVFYKRYVDDTFVIFKKREHAQKFFDYMNTKHHKIKFTMEAENNNKIPFLDILIEKQNNRLDLSIYRKPTFSGLGVNFISACYANFKLNTFCTLFYRAFRLSSSYINFHNELCFLSNFFAQNGFPSQMFYKSLRCFLNKIFCPKPLKEGPRKLEFYFKLPYMSDNLNSYVKKELNNIFCKYFPHIKACAIFYNNCKLKNYVNHKDKLPSPLCSMVVYLYKCPICQLAYVGSTKKCLLQRYHEHNGSSCRTGKMLASPPSSSIRDHCKRTCKCIISCDDFQVIYKGDSDIEIRIAESLLIGKHRPKLNKDISCYPLKLI